jgi:hypothetical protein
MPPVPPAPSPPFDELHPSSHSASSPRDSPPVLKNVR